MSCQERAGTHFLEGLGVEAEPDSQCLIFLEKVLLKGPCAVSSDSVACQCLNCSFLLAPFPKCSYSMSGGYKSMLLTCSFSCLFFSNPRMEISPSLWISRCDAVALTPSQLHAFPILFSPARPAIAPRSAAALC